MKNIPLILLLSLAITSYSKMPDLNTLVGQYAHYDIVAYSGKLFGPIRLESNIISYGITEFYLKNQKLFSKDRFCFSEYKANIPFQSKTSDEFTRAIIPKDIEMEILQTNNEVLVHRPETPTLLGVNLKSYKENFPSNTNDPRFIDADKDGKPGVTVNLSLGSFFKEQLYIARKEIFSYDIKLQKNGIWVGVVRDRSQQYIIDATREDLKKPNNPIQNKDLSKSPIYLIPLKEKLDCNQLKESRDLYFPKKYKYHKRFYKRLN